MEFMDGLVGLTYYGFWTWLPGSGLRLARCFFGWVQGRVDGDGIRWGRRIRPAGAPVLPCPFPLQRGWWGYSGVTVTPISRL